MSETDTNEVIISVVIPTLNRTNYLEEALQSLLKQTKLPNEIIVVDQSDDSKTQTLIKKELQFFLKKGTTLKYLWEETKSITHARNVGTRASKGDIVFFLDDDMRADRHYICEVLRAFHDNPNAIGVQGSLFPPPYWEGVSKKAIFANSLRRTFLLIHWERNTQKVLLSGETVVAYPLTRTISAMVIFPAGSAFKRKILRKIPLDENLKGYSWQDELFTLKLGKLRPDSLLVVPSARLHHNYALDGRPIGKQIHHIMATYELYNFCNNINPSMKNWIAFFWKVLGKIIIALPDLRRKERRIRLLYILQSYSWALRNFSAVRNAGFNER